MRQEPADTEFLACPSSNFLRKTSLVCVSDLELFSKEANLLVR